jgi:hypothetical protein
MTTTPSTVEELLDYWPGHIPFKGSLVSEDGSCMCAQGQVLHFLDKLNPDDLRMISQADADKRVAEIFGISNAHSVLLRIVNDRQDGAPTSVIRNPEQVLGDQSHVVLAFWRRLDQMNDKSWAAARAAARAAAGDAAEAAWDAARTAARTAAWDAARVAAWDAARVAAWDAAWDAAGDAAKDAAWDAAEAAAGASNEIQGGAGMRAKGQPFLFLPLFGFADPEAVMAANEK